MRLAPQHLGFRPLKTSDLALMVKWLNTDFVMQWYGTLERSAIEAKYLKRIQGEHFVKPYIILYADQPIGYIQAYQLRDTDAAYQAALNIPDVAAVDLFIGETNFIHKGLGAALLGRFIREIVFELWDVEGCIIAPDLSNLSAIKSYYKAGFQHVKTVTVPEKNEPEYVMYLSRESMKAMIRVRASLALVHDAKILLVPHYYPNQPTRWFIPGGGVHFGETLQAAAMREAQEETGLFCLCGKFLHLEQVIEPHWHGIGITFLGQILGGELKAEVHPVYGRKEARWFSITDLQSINYEPRLAIMKAFYER